MLIINRALMSIDESIIVQVNITGRLAVCYRSSMALTRVFMIIVILGLQPSISAASNSEDTLRAAVIGGILRYTQWQDSSQKTLCALGAPKSEDMLLQASHRVRANRQVISILKVSDQTQLNECQILVIGEVPEFLNTSLLKLLTTGNTLSICDGCKHDRWPTSITLIRHKNHIRFDIDLTYTKKSSITFSASLLELALHIKGLSNEQ